MQRLHKQSRVTSIQASTTFAHLAGDVLYAQGGLLGEVLEAGKQLVGQGAVAWFAVGIEHAD